MYFSETARAQAAGHTVRADILVEFRFQSETIRLWRSGFGKLRTNDGRLWDGFANLGSIDGLNQAAKGQAPTQSFTVSGIEQRFVEIAKASRDEYFGRYVFTYLQFFRDEGGTPNDWQCLDNPYALTMRRMENLQLVTAKDSNGTKTTTLSVKAETPFSFRKRPPNGFNTDRDQRLRHNDDPGMEFVAGIDSSTITWPDY